MSFEKPSREDPVRSVDRTAALSKIFLFERALELSSYSNFRMAVRQQIPIGGGRVATLRVDGWMAKVGPRGEWRVADER